MEAGAGALHRSGAANQGKEQGAQGSGCREKGIANIPCETPQGAGCPYCRADGELEELRSEKALLFQKFEYAEDAGAEEFRKDIATMEAGLKKLEAQEQKYSAELDKALDEYAELKAQAADFDPVELYKARQVIRPAQEKAAEQQLEDAMHEKPSLIMLLSAKQETSRLLGEDAEERQARQMVIRRQRSDPQKPKHFQR